MLIKNPPDKKHCTYRQAGRGIQDSQLWLQVENGRSRIFFFLLYLSRLSSQDTQDTHFPRISRDGMVPVLMMPCVYIIPLLSLAVVMLINQHFLSVYKSICGLNAVLNIPAAQRFLFRSSTLHAACMFHSSIVSFYRRSSSTYRFFEQTVSQQCPFEKVMTLVC